MYIDRPLGYYTLEYMKSIPDYVDAFILNWDCAKPEEQVGMVFSNFQVVKDEEGNITSASATCEWKLPNLNPRLHQKTQRKKLKQQ